MKTLDEKLKECKSLVVYRGQEECEKILHERNRKMQRFQEGEGITKSASTTLRAPAGDRITVPGLGVPSEIELSTLLEQRQMPPLQEGQVERFVPWFGSDERVDNEGDIVRQNWNFDDFQDNSPMPFSHKWEDPPVGRVVDWRVVQRSDSDYQGPALWLLCLFSGSDPFAESIFRLVKEGFLKGGSVGFFSSEIIDITDEEERNEIGLGRFGLIFSRNNLLEFSPATIPANPGAIALRALTKGTSNLRGYDLQVLRECHRRLIVDGQGDAEQWKSSDEVLLDVARALFPDQDWGEHKDLETPVTEGIDVPLEDEEAMKKELETLTEAVEELTKAVGEIKTDLQAEIKETVATEVKMALEVTNTKADPGDGETPPEPADLEASDGAKTLLAGIFDKLASVKEDAKDPEGDE